MIKSVSIIIVPLLLMFSWLYEADNKSPATQLILVDNLLPEWVTECWSIGSLGPQGLGKLGFLG
jgi:hypothetical protein